MRFERLHKGLKYILSIFVSLFMPIKRKQIVFWSTYGNNYSCNPRALAEYLVEHPQLGFDVYYAFEKGRVSPECKASILIIGSLSYIFRLNTAEFVFTNHRTTSPRSIYWRKRNNQKYIMSWHGSMPLKMIEKDTIEVLGLKYENEAILDSNNCDLMISDNDWFTKTIRRAFWYKGEIFEGGVPRNDVFFNTDKRNSIVNKVFSKFEIPEGSAVILYAPTFRTDHSLAAYIKEWDDCLEEFKKKLGRDVILLTRLHPGMIGEKSFVLTSKKHRIIDATFYDEMQDLLVAADILITDFSSTMFEFSLLNKPCFLIAADIYSYDRNLYFSFDILPFKKYSNIFEFVKELPHINFSDYVKEQKDFVNSIFSPKYNPDASGELAKWLIKHSMYN